MFRKFNPVQALIHRGYWAPADDGTGSGGGGGSGSGEGGEGGDGASEGTGDEGGAGEGGGQGDGGDTKPKPTDSEAKLLKEVMERKTALKEANKALAEANKKLAAYDGVNPEEIEAKGQWDALKTQMAEQHKKDIGAKDAAIAERDTALSAANAKIAELTVGNAFGASSYIAKEMDLPVSKVRQLFGPHFEFDGTKVVGYTKPAGSKDRVALVGSDGEPLSFEDALKKLVESDPDKDRLLKSTLAAGAGSGTERTAGGPAAVAQELTGRDRIAAALKARQKK
jgi:hypothetical protein